MPRVPDSGFEVCDSVAPSSGGGSGGLEVSPPAGASAGISLTSASVEKRTLASPFGEEVSVALSAAAGVSRPACAASEPVLTGCSETGCSEPLLTGCSAAPRSSGCSAFAALASASLLLASAFRALSSCCCILSKTPPKVLFSTALDSRMAASSFASSLRTPASEGFASTTDFRSSAAPLESPSSALARPRRYLALALSGLRRSTRPQRSTTACHAPRLNSTWAQFRCSVESSSSMRGASSAVAEGPWDLACASASLTEPRLGVGGPGRRASSALMPAQ
mmetsp:Transcript_60786/g.170345  ORF Transcript_60786/g.170345 Transcript_60786/m.170345 type:complete len:279 (-) Transcript_60786:553-1389(-)